MDVMSRSGYSDECENVGLWRGAVVRAMEGKRGQSFLCEMAAALDAMPVKELIAGEVVDSTYVCAIGSVAVARKLDVSNIDPSDGESIGQVFGIARALACEIAYMNDDYGPPNESPSDRWVRMRLWVADAIGELE